MKAVLALLAAAPIMLAQADGPSQSGDPDRQVPVERWHDSEASESVREQCRETIRRVRADTGQPALRRETPDPDNPLLIAAVDRRIDGCAVMVMRQDNGDIRPLPTPAEGPVRLIPAR